MSLKEKFNEQSIRLTRHDTNRVEFLSGAIKEVKINSRLVKKNQVHLTIDQERSVLSCDSYRTDRSICSCNMHIRVA